MALPTAPNPTSRLTVRSTVAASVAAANNPTFLPEAIPEPPTPTMPIPFAFVSTTEAEMTAGRAALALFTDKRDAEMAMGKSLSNASSLPVTD